MPRERKRSRVHEKASVPSEVFLLPIFLTAATGLRAAESDAAQRPDYLGLVKAYAAAMIRDGRDTTGSERSPLFASALDRKTLRFGAFGDIPGIRNSDRSLGGANPQTDAPLYSILYESTPATTCRGRAP